MAGGFQAFFPSYAARSEAHPGFTLSATQKSTSCHVVPRRAGTSVWSKCSTPPVGRLACSGSAPAGFSLGIGM